MSHRPSHIAPTFFKILLLSTFIIIFTQCANVEAYERVYLNDEEMKLDTKDCAHFETYFQVIREGGSGAGGGKTGGGCGCN